MKANVFEKIRDDLRTDCKDDEVRSLLAEIYGQIMATGASGYKNEVITEFKLNPSETDTQITRHKSAKSVLTNLGYKTSLLIETSEYGHWNKVALRISWLETKIHP